MAPRGALAGGVRAPSATEARRRVDPGNARRRPAGWRRRRARARGGAALLALSLQLSLARTPTSRGNKRRKKHVGPIFDRPTRFGRGFSLSVQQGIQNVRARVLTRRCYSLISHCLVNSITVVVAQNTPLFSADPHETNLTADARPAQERLARVLQLSRTQEQPSRAALAQAGRIAHLIRQPAEGPRGCPRASKR